MAGALRGGRPWGPIRAESEEAAALARFLRAQVDASGKTLTVLADEIGYSKSRIGAFLAGNVSGERFVTALVSATTVREPRLRERRLTEAAKLLYAAEHPSPTTASTPAASAAVELAAARAQQVETYERLTRALEQQNQLHEAAGNSTKLIMVLLSMINKLEQRITDLTGEADQLRAAQGDPVILKSTRQQLARAQDQERRAQLELARAQEKQRQTEDLAAQVQARVDQLTDELDRLRTGSSDSVADDTVPARIPQQTSASADPVGDDIDQALARAIEVNDQDDNLLKRITDDLRTVSGPVRVIQDKQPDNSPASPDVTDNTSLLHQVYQAETEGRSGNAFGAAGTLARLVSEMAQAMGWEHPDTLTTRRALLHWQGEDGHALGAAQGLGHLVSDMERVLGAEHPETLTTRRTLLHWRQRAADGPAGSRNHTW